MGRRHVEEDEDLDLDVGETEEGGVVTDDDDDEDLVWDRDEDDVEDDDDDIEDDPEAHNSEDREFTGDDADDAPAKPKAEPEPSVRDQLSAAALHGLRGKGRDKPLSAQSNQWVLSTIGRLVEAGSEPGSPAANDLRLLMDAVEKRGIPESLSNATHAEVARIIRSDTPAPTAPAESRPPRPVVVAGEEIVHIALADIDPDPAQARDEGADDELADSIAVNGVLQPIRVYPRGGRWMIEDGERRYRGAVKAGDTTIPAREVPAPADVGDKLLRQVTLNEGKRLKPMEEARSWKRIMESKHWSAAQLATAIGKPKSTVSDRLAILDAPAAFQPLFAKGALTAAAAPIVRKYAGVPESILREAVAELENNGAWADSIGRGVPVPVDDVREGLEEELTSSWTGRLSAIDKSLAAEYSGGVVTINGQKYATDVDAYKAVESKGAPAHEPGVAAKRESSKAEREYAERQRKERAAHEKKRLLRQAQFAALQQKLPTTLDGEWALLLVRWLTNEIQQDYLRLACKAFGITPPKHGTYGGFDFAKALIGHAAMLTKAGDRVKFALLLLLAHDLQVSSYDTRGPERFAAAAKLLKIDLAKVKPPVDEQDEKPVAAKPAKSAKKRR